MINHFDEKEINMPTENWVVVADSANARVYSQPAHKRHEPMTLKHELAHSDSKKRDAELVADRPGHYHKGEGGPRGAYAPHSDPKAVEIDTFARELANLLEDGRLQNQYQQLVLFAEPHFYGLIGKHLNSHVKERVKQVIQKDYMHLTEPELRAALNGS